MIRLCQQFLQRTFRIWNSKGQVHVVRLGDNLSQMSKWDGHVHRVVQLGLGQSLKNPVWMLPKSRKRWSSTSLARGALQGSVIFGSGTCSKQLQHIAAFQNPPSPFSSFFHVFDAWTETLSIREPMCCTTGKDASLKRSSSVFVYKHWVSSNWLLFEGLPAYQLRSYSVTLVQAVLFESQLLSSTCDGEMPLRRHRVWPFVAIAFLFRMQLNFVGPPSPQRHAPARIARQLWPRKSEGSESHQDINSMDVGSVSRWLTTMDLKKYVSKFEDASVDGKLLANLTDEDLQEIGVDRGIHRKKILTRRDDLVGQSLAPSAVLDQWRSDRPGEGDATKPDLERRQFATRISNYMKKAGLTLGVAQAKIVEEVDNIEHNLLEQSILLDALQSMNEWAWSQTVDQPGEECVREEVQKDLIQIQLAKAGLKQRMVVTSVNSKQLAVAIISYCESVKSSKASNSEKTSL